MFKIVEYPKIQDFFNENKKVIYKNRLAHYHLIQYFDELNAGNQSVYQAYNVIDEDGGSVIAVWGDSVYYLYALKWSEAIIDGLLSKIDIAKYTKRFSFCGTSKLVADLFNKSGVVYQVFKKRVLYECKSVLPIIRQCNGSALFSTADDLEIVAEMTHRYGIEEWGVREGRDLGYARQLSYQSILQETSRHWEANGEIVTIASILDDYKELPIIGSLYTNPQHRGKGYAKCLVYEITRQITTNNGGRCGIVSDASDPITNRMFQEIGFKEISQYISIHTKRENI
ncbi:GNAT family N-acetyltransferase [Mucilaginibacter sp.]|uniref:GNAT family N-acetyltransferase n=1 Tax=Mucilaginibacter sp. TaxID=1882438 RepID=UPI000CC1B567|nr:GNAT family N-acetyltransferase [Mucilaginibacter sp.]PLW88520.1 MAG: hypothetical protein C0154_16480 [Mucilaginibacter sp.]PMP66225.1 MAG: hypothetical protein C0191_01450 [Mucilaginibacter sp.]HEK22205.1 GNAT family N-acetyltransferase [Bacteroidota bacterium]